MLYTETDTSLSSILHSKLINQHSPAVESNLWSHLYLDRYTEELHNIGGHSIKSPFVLAFSTEEWSSKSIQETQENNFSITANAVYSDLYPQLRSITRSSKHD